MATQKELYVVELIRISNTLSQVMEKPELLTGQYFDLGYNSGGSDPIVDGDLINFNGIVAADVTNAITALEQLTNYFSNSAVTQGDYAASYNNLIYGKLTTV